MEPRRPRTDQSNRFYIVFAIVMYVYLGTSVESPAFSSLPPKWAKATVRPSPTQECNTQKDSLY